MYYTQGRKRRAQLQWSHAWHQQRGKTKPNNRGHPAGCNVIIRSSFLSLRPHYWLQQFSKSSCLLPDSYKSGKKKTYVKQSNKNEKKKTGIHIYIYLYIYRKTFHQRRKNKLFFTICTLFVGNHTHTHTKVWDVSKSPLTPYFHCEHDQQAQSDMHSLSAFPSRPMFVSKAQSLSISLFPAVCT